MIRVSLLLAALVVATPLAAQTLSPDQMRSFGMQLLQHGESGRAVAVADALLARDPQDAVALIIKARAARDLGETGQARSSAKAAWSAAKTQDERFTAAMTRAQALSSSGRRTEAQFWLRRAIQSAPSDAAKRLALRDFRYVRHRNPLSLSFSFAVAPSSNVNSGSKHDNLGGFLGSDVLRQALSGWTAEGSVSGSYRLSAEGSESQTHLRFAAQRREVRLSSDARGRIKAWQDSLEEIGLRADADTNYDYGALEIGLGHQRRFGDIGTSGAVTLGHNWYGGASLSDYVKLDLMAQKPIARDWLLFGGLEGEHQSRKDGPGRDANILSTTLGAVTQLTSGDRLRFAVGHRSTASDSVSIRHDAAIMRLGWEKGTPVAGLGLQAALTGEWRDYDASAVAAGGRRDQRLTAQLSVTLEKFDYMGFAPTISLQASRFRSNVRAYDGGDVGMLVGFRSLF